MTKGFICFCLLLSVLGSCCSGNQVGFSYDATSMSSSPNEAIKFLNENGVAPSQVGVLVADELVLSSLCGRETTVLYVVDGEKEALQRSKISTFSWVKNQAFSSSSCTNRIFIVLNGHVTSKRQLSNLLSSLRSLQSALATLKIGSHVKLSVSFPLPLWKHAFEEPLNSFTRKLRLLIDRIRRSGTSVILSVRIDGEWSMGDGFVQSCAEIINNVTRALPYDYLPILINVQNNAVSSPTELSQFSKEVIQYLKNQDHIWPKFLELFAEVSFMESFEQQELNREHEQIFPSERRELLYQTDISNHTTRYDATNGPVFNPAAPITNPVTPPAITVPPTVPATTPVTNPVTVPSTVPVTTPGTVPLTPPVTNPVTTPSTMPITNPVTNPITTPGTSPVPTPFTTPSTTPVTIPVITPTNPITVSPTVSGQSWCTARRGSLTASLQVALDYACGVGGADCSAIQQNGVCYYPNALENHASYAFNNYYLKNPVPTSCSFGGTAIIVNTDPSSGSCIYPSASPITNPITSNNPITGTSPSTGTGITTSGSLPTVLNTSNPLGSTVFGAQPPIPNKSMSKWLHLSSLCSLLLTMLFFSIAKHL